MKLLALLSACVMMVQPVSSPAEPITAAVDLPSIAEACSSVPVYNPISEQVALSSEAVTDEPDTEDYFYSDIPLSQEKQLMIYEICEEYGVDYPLVLGILSVESNFKTNVSYKNKNGSTDMGIAQINSYYLDHYADMAQIPRKDFDPYIFEHGIRALCGDLQYLTESYQEDGYSGDELTIHVLNGYNMGQGGYNKYKRRTGSISRYYDKKVMSAVSSLSLASTDIFSN